MTWIMVGLRSPGYAAGMLQLYVRYVGVLFLLDLVAYLPFFSAVFGDLEERGFPPKSSRKAWAVAAVWLASGLAMVFGRPEVQLLGSAGLFALFRRYYIDRRWKSIRRGGGAPGFMSHWTMLFLTLVQMARYVEPSGLLSQQTLWVMQVDFGVIMICAGVYKVMIGYLEGDGMEYGRANPFWGYHWRHYRHSSPRSWHVRILNFLGSVVEIVAGVAMLMPNTVYCWLGALSITLGFVYVAAFIRLGRLAFLMMSLPLIYHPAMSEGLASPLNLQAPHWMVQAAILLCQGYVMLLPLVKMTQYYNLFAHRKLPEPWQSFSTAFANAVPIIIWRVFTPDVTNFFVRIYEVQGDREVALVHEDTTYSYRNWGSFFFQWRFLHVGESIALTSVFTTLRYFPSQPALFQHKLLAYARSLQWSLGRPIDQFRFEYVAIVKGEKEFGFETMGDCRVWPESGRVQCELFGQVATASRLSPMQETEHPGSYVAAAGRG